MSDKPFFIRTAHFAFSNPEVCNPFESITLPNRWRYIAPNRKMDGQETHGNCIVWNYFGLIGDRELKTITTTPQTIDEVLDMISDEIMSNIDQFNAYLKYLDNRPFVVDMLQLPPAMYFFISEENLMVILEGI